MKFERRRLQKDFKKPSRTKQAFKAECDINNILAKYNKTNLITHVNRVQGNYGDFSNATDYQTALNAVMDANERFMGLPAQVRQKFNNNPASFIDFVSDDQNYDEALKLGLIAPEKAQAYLASKEAKETPPSSKAPKAPKNDD